MVTFYGNISLMTRETWDIHKFTSIQIWQVWTAVNSIKLKNMKFIVTFSMIQLYLEDSSNIEKKLSDQRQVDTGEYNAQYSHKVV